MKYPKGHEFELKILSPSLVKYDPLYQRELDGKRAAKIAAEFNGDLFNEPKVSYRDGAYWCFNGQHSIAAWKILHNNEDEPVKCKVFRGMTWLEECEAFVAQNGLSKDPTTNQKLRAAYNSGNPDVVTMKNLATQAGFIVDFNRGQIKNRIVCTSTLFKALKKLGPEPYLEMLTVIQGAWKGEPESVSNQIISGMTTFYDHYYGNFKMDDLTKNLSRVTPVEIIRNGKNYTTMKNGYTREIVRQYNKGRRYKLNEAEL